MRAKKAKGLVVTGVSIERQQLRRLDAVAAREQRTRSYMIRAAIDRELAFREMEPR